MDLENIPDDTIAQTYVDNMQTMRRVAQSLNMPDVTLGLLMFLGSRHATCDNVVPFKEICQALSSYHKSNVSEAGTRLMKRGLIGKTAKKQRRIDVYLTGEGVRLYESAVQSYSAQIKATQSSSYK
jgi:hypothetical protein